MRIEGDPGTDLTDVWVYLTPDEALDLMIALAVWAEADPPKPGWHTHVTDGGRELTIAVGPGDDGSDG